MADNHNNSCGIAAQSLKSNLELIDNLVQCINLAQDLAIEVELEFKKLLQQLRQIDIQTEAAAVNTKKLKFSVEVDKKIPSSIQTDKFRLHMILMNLVSNAIEFTETGHVKIRVKISAQDNNKLLLTVEDSGIGFDMKNSDYILGAFNKLTPSYKGQNVGLGIGLTIAKTLLHELNGELKISSQIGKGSCFECVLPIK